MRFLAACTIAVALSPVSAHAICLVEPLEPRLRGADVVYVGTVVRSELAGTLPSGEEAENPWKRRIELRHTLQPEITLKGDPSVAPTVLSAWQYNPPRSGRTVDIAELSELMPGDTLLVVAHTGHPTHVGLCSPSRKWNAEAAEVVDAVFPPAL